MTYTMRQARDMIEHAIENPLGNGQHRVIYLEGDPGIGKTALHRSVFEKYRRTSQRPDGFTHFIPFIAPEREPTDIGGLPMPNETRTGVRMLPLEDLQFSSGDRPYIFFDEIDKAISMMQNAIGRVMHEQTICDTPLPTGTFIAAAGNLMTNRAGSVVANTHIKNRRTHVPVNVAPLEWIEDVAIPFGIHPSVVSYIRIDPEMLHKFDASAPSFPSPRSWTKVGLALNTPMPDHVERAFIEGDIGTDAANVFHGHLKMYHGLRKPEEFIGNPKGIELPKGTNKVAIMYCEVTMLAKHANPQNCDAVFTYFSRLPGEYGFIGFRDVMQRRKELFAASKVGQAWFIANATTLKATAS